MPLGVIRILKMKTTVVQDFYLSTPDNLKRRVLENVLATGLEASVFAGNRIQFKDEDAGIELSVLCGWIECCGWQLSNATGATLSKKNLAFLNMILEKQEAWEDAEACSFPHGDSAMTMLPG
mmetsp:Transcript_12532/g.27088  ORF Transcript_12532/g.27088 Transcript_12532/m.27088 type:complete len:122 (+) Transcript_12532:127-492(+)